jgi:transcriptional regulator with XRE-family HTH domain
MHLYYCYTRVVHYNSQFAKTFVKILDTLCILNKAMPRPPKPENLRNPLRILRGLLSENSDKLLLSQRALSEIINVPANTIRAIESGQRRSTAANRVQIASATGAYWDPKRNQWMYSSPDAPDRPYSRKLYLQHRRIVTRRPHDHNKEVHRLMTRLRQLFLNVPDKDWHKLWFHVADFLEKCESDFNPKKQRRPEATSVERGTDELQRSDLGANQ